MHTLDTLIGIIVGLGLGLIFHAFLYVRGQIHQKEDLSEAHEQGRRSGYHQCYKEMVRPLNAKATPAHHNSPTAKTERVAVSFPFSAR